MVSTGIAPEGDVFYFIRTEAYPAISEENGFFKSSIEVNSPGEYVVNVQFGTTLLGNPYIFKVIPAQVGISNAPADHHHACLSTECTVLDIQAFEGELFNPAFIGANDRMGRENPDYKLSIRVRDVYGNDLSDSVGSVDGVEGLSSKNNVGGIHSLCIETMHHLDSGKEEHLNLARECGLVDFVLDAL